MAGIGFSLRKLFDKKGLLNLCRAYGYTGIVSAGPVLLGMGLLVGVSYCAKLGGMDPHDRELLNCMLTYSLLVSLTVTSLLNMAVTRFVSDMLYEERPEKVMPAFYGSTAIMLVICAILYGTFLHFSGVELKYQLLCLWYSLILIVVWNETIFLTAVKDYRAIVLSFAISLLAGFLLILVMIYIGRVSIESFLLCVIIAYGLLMCRNLGLLLAYFPKMEGSSFSFLAWMDKYRPLVVGSVMVNIGLFGHLVIMYFGPLQVKVQGLFYGAPTYDVAALCAYFTMLITTINFVASVEVKFFPKYQRYYGLFNDRGAVGDIRQVGEEMLAVLRRELMNTARKQLLVTILAIVIVPPLMESLPMGFGNMTKTIFCYLCVGYGTYAIANSVMLIQLYFEDYIGAMVGTVLFGLVSSAVTIWQILHGDPLYYGVGFVLGSLVFYLAATIGLEIRTRRLAYYLLARQSILPHQERGLLIWLSRKLDERAEKKQRKKQEAAA